MNFFTTSNSLIKVNNIYLSIIKQITIIKFSDRKRMCRGVYVSRREKVKKGWKTIPLDVGQIKGKKMRKGMKIVKNDVEEREDDVPNGREL